MEEKGIGFMSGLGCKWNAHLYPADNGRRKFEQKISLCRCRNLTRKVELALTGGGSSAEFGPFLGVGGEGVDVEAPKQDQLLIELQCPAHRSIAL